MKSRLFLALLATVATLHARSIIPDRAEDLQITIYNDNLAFVDEKRSVQLPAGEQELVYEGVAGKVITESVIPTFTGAKVRLYSQNFIYNLVTLRHHLSQRRDRLCRGIAPSGVRADACTRAKEHAYGGHALTRRRGGVFGVSPLSYPFS